MDSHHVQGTIGLAISRLYIVVYQKDLGEQKKKNVLWSQQVNFNQYSYENCVHQILIEKHITQAIFVS